MKKQHYQSGELLPIVQQWPDYVAIILATPDGHASGKLTIEKGAIYGTIQNLYVSSDIRKSGIGQFILNELESVAKQYGLQQTYLWVDHESWMQKWYERSGYAFFGIRGDGTDWMKKELI